MESPLKVLIYSSKEIYDNSGFEGRAESDLIAYRDNDCYIIIKSKISNIRTKQKYYCAFMEALIGIEEERIYNKIMNALD
jgi:hypothetical protein